MTPAKRLFDLLCALVLCPVLVPVMAVTALVVLAVDGRPVLFVSERMKTPERGFALVKFRTMVPDTGDTGVSGGHKAARITRTGAFLRRTRLDETPQLWNVLRGDISFVGPRPPLREYVERFPDLYARVLRSRPGLTGLASLHFHAREVALLAPCRDRAEADAVYSRRCVPRKARIDLIYQENRSLCMDAAIMLATVFRRRGRGSARRDRRSG